MEKMEILWSLVGILVSGYALVLFGILKKVNEWYYVVGLGEKRKYLPPGDMGWPLLGDNVTLLRNPSSFVSNIILKHGKGGVYKSNLFGYPTVITCVPETCKKVLQDQDQFKFGYPESTRRLTGQKSIHDMTNEDHKHYRKLLAAPINGHEALAIYVTYIEDAMVKALEEWGRDEKPVEIVNKMRKVGFKIISKIFLGSSDNPTFRDNAEKHYIALSNGLISAPINIPGFVFHKAIKGRNDLLGMLEAIIRERRAIDKSLREGLNKGMVDLLMDVADENGKKFTDQNIVDFLSGSLLAGHESTAHAGMWALKFVYGNPEALKKAKEEQEEILKRRPSTQKGLTLNEIREMHYAYQIIDETLRIVSGAFPLFREATADVMMKGYLIPKGWKVLVWNMNVHMDPETYPSPEKFNPSRWDGFRPKPGSYQPFGRGARVCPGADLAKLEIIILLHYFLLNYKLEVVNPECPMQYLPTMKPIDNCLANVIKL